MTPRYSPPLSAVVWNAAAVAALGQSATFRSFNCPFVTVGGTTSGVSDTVTLLGSDDGVNWYPTGLSATVSAAGGFGFSGIVGADFLALQSKSGGTITAVISAK